MRLNTHSVSRNLVHSMMAPMRAFSYLVLLCLVTSTVAADDGQYIIKPSQQSRSRVSGSGAACSLVDNGLNLAQFVNNLSEFLISGTTLIFCSGNHNLKSELIVENVHSFSMFVWPDSSLKAVIKDVHLKAFSKKDHL